MVTIGPRPREANLAMAVWPLYPLSYVPKVSLLLDVLLNGAGPGITSPGRLPAFHTNRVTYCC